MLKIGQVIIDRRGREQEHLLVFAQVIEVPIARTAGLRAQPAIPEVVGLVYDDDIRLILELRELIREVSAVGADTAHEVGVVENLKRQEPVEQVRKIAPNVAFPDGFAARFRDEQDHALFLKHHEALDQHQADKGFPKTDTVAK